MRVVRGPLIISSSLGLNKKRNEEKCETKWWSGLFICVRCFFSFLIFVVEGRFLILLSFYYLAASYIICAHLSYMRIIKQLRQKVRKWAVCVNDRRMRKTLKNPRSTHRHTQSNKTMFYTIPQAWASRGTTGLLLDYKAKNIKYKRKKYNII
jgi:hypothetical protein